MKTIKIIIICLSLASTILIDDTFSISATVQAREDYRFSLKIIRYLHVTIENFGDEQTKKDFNNIRTLFREASENYYGKNYFEAHSQFRKIKTDLVLLSRKIANNYLNRTKEMLDTISKESYTILIDYSKNSPLAEFLWHPFDPFRDIKTYDPKKFHYFHNREKIETYLDNGYKNYHTAKKIFNDPDVNYMLTKKNVPTKGLNFIIKKYVDTINLCRNAKTLGIAIYKIKNLQKMEDVIYKYNIHANRLYPILDERIPDKYKVDASDNNNLIHSIELKKIQNNMKEIK